jgi:hypothetical protein
VGLGPDRTGLICKQSGPTVWSQFLKLNGPSFGEKDWTGLYAMVTKVGIVIPSDLEPMSVITRRYS